MIVAVAGPIASGKSTLARALAKRLGGEYASFGEFVRKALDGASPDRRALQNVGEGMVRRDSAEFTRSFLNSVNWTSTSTLVVDGLRHEAVRQELVREAAAAGRKLKLIYLDVDYEERRRRWKSRLLESADLVEVDMHPSEQEVSILRERADLRLNVGLPVNDLVSRVLQSLRLEDRSAH